MCYHSLNDGHQKNHKHCRSVQLIMCDAVNTIILTDSHRHTRLRVDSFFHDHSDLGDALSILKQMNLITAHHLRRCWPASQGFLANTAQRQQCQQTLGPSSGAVAYQPLSNAPARARRQAKREITVGVCTPSAEHLREAVTGSEVSGWKDKTRMTHLEKGN